MEGPGDTTQGSRPPLTARLCLGKGTEVTGMAVRLGGGGGGRLGAQEAARKPQG